MNLKVIGKNLDITDAIRDYAEKKVERLEKFEGKSTDVTIVCSIEREEQIAEIQINHDGDFIKVEERNPDLYASIDLAMDKIERQMRKGKEKRDDKKKDFRQKFMNIFGGANVNKENGEVTKTKRYEIKPLKLEDAKLKLEDSGDMFLTFINADTQEVNVIYQRGDGTFGLVVPE